MEHAPVDQPTTADRAAFDQIMAVRADGVDRKNLGNGGAFRALAIQSSVEVTTAERRAETSRSDAVIDLPIDGQRLLPMTDERARSACPKGTAATEQEDRLENAALAGTVRAIYVVSARV